MKRIKQLLTNYFEWLRNTKQYNANTRMYANDANKKVSYIRKSIFRSPFFFVHVQGESAWPTLVPGTLYLATNVVSPKIGDFIVFRNPMNIQEVFVKRVSSICDNCYHVESLVSWGSSSRDFGLVGHELILGKLLC
ncbi:MAG: hypothetical protein G01um101433_472 [Parcubacteria group bacterium Gr01-1014_33]|nr:MAG: hypothetical protein G01um101433_472 [Parcubacteria group bacterium Gr01-1014_33]